MSISVFCVFLSVCSGQISDVLPPELTNKSEVSNSSTEKHNASIILNTLKAFPTAEGAGAGATGGRGGKAVYVTNNHEKGPGSFFEAVTGYGNQKRTILFAVGGRFNISTWEWQENKGNFTLAGQTAQGLGGVHLISIPYHDGSDGSPYADSLKSNPNGSLYLTHGNNMIIRYLDAKGGWESGTNVENRFNAFGTQRCTNVIYDHYSSGFSSYLLKIGGFNKNNGKEGNITVQYSLGHEGILGQNLGFSLGSYLRFMDEGLTDSEKIEQWRKGSGQTDIHHNAFILLTHRQTGNVHAGDSGRYKKINNYVYGIGSRLDSVVGRSKIDYVNNVYEAANRGDDITVNELHKFEVSYLESQRDILQETLTTSLFFKGNQVIKQNGSDLINEKDDQWQMVQMKFDQELRYPDNNSPLYGLSNHDAVPKKSPYYRTSPIPVGKYPITLMPTNKVKKHVLLNAGAGVRFNIDGTVFNQDEIDQRYINYALSNSSPSTYLGDTNRFSIPKYTSKSIDLDTFDADRDGLPDAWETKHKVSDANSIKENWIIQGYTIKNLAGYTNLEMYLAELAGDFHILSKK